MYRMRFDNWYKPGVVHFAGALQVLLYFAGLCWAASARVKERRKQIRYTQLPVITSTNTLEEDGIEGGDGGSGGAEVDRPVVHNDDGTFDFHADGDLDDGDDGDDGAV